MHNLSIYLTYTNPSFFEFRTERAKSLSLCLVELVVDLGSSFWGMALILASTNLLTARIAAAGLGLALFIVLFIAKNVRRSHYFSYLTKFYFINIKHWDLQFWQWTLRGLCIGVLSHESSCYIFLVSTQKPYIVIWISGFIVFLAIVWVLQELTTVKILRYVILFIGKIPLNSSPSC